MIKEKDVAYWLRECTDATSEKECCECPYFNYEDCAGKLMQDAAVILAVEGDNTDG